MDTSFVGKKTGISKIVIERSPTSNFARAVLDKNDNYFNLDVAKSNGFDSIPTPPTFGFAWANFGAFSEIQPEVGDDVDQSAMGRAMGELTKDGGLMLHGEQSFEYFNPVVVGDVLVSSTEIVDMYEKESKDRTMRFLVTETTFVNEATSQIALKTRMNLICRI